MKTLAITILIVSACFGEYQTGKIDMHGGKSSHLYGNTKSTFGKKALGVSIFSDNNATKKSTQIKEKK
ncbi:MAG: hypothetical protein ABFQ64_09290 [Campylobacterota bacterium]